MKKREEWDSPTGYEQVPMARNVGCEVEEPICIHPALRTATSLAALLRERTFSTSYQASLSSMWVDRTHICEYTRMRIYDESATFYVDP
jgi:hypothetical protein